MSLVALRPVGFLLDCEQYEQSSEQPPVLPGHARISFAVNLMTLPGIYLLDIQESA